MFRHFVRLMSRNIATVEDNIIKMPDIETAGFKLHSNGIGYAYFQAILKNKNKTFQINATTGESDTYENLLWRCVRTAINLKKSGVTNNDLISSCSSYAHLNSCVPYIAATFIGAKFSGLDPRFPLPYIVQTLNKIRPKYIFIDKQHAELIENAVKESTLNTNFISFDKYKEYQYFDDLIKPIHEEKEFKPYESTSVYETVVIYSVIQTGLELVHISHYTLMAQTFLFCGMRKTKLNVLMAFATFKYTLSASIFFTSAIFEGGSMLLVPEFDAKFTWFIINKYKVNFLFVLPSQAHMMQQEKLAENTILDSFMELCIGGSELKKQTIEKLRIMLPTTKLVQCYGQAEAGGCVLSFNYDYPEVFQNSIRKITSSGVPLYGYWYKVVDFQSNKPLGINKEGELYLKSKIIMNIPPDSTFSSRITQDGWLKTGDVVYFDEDLCFFIIDPVKEIYKYKNWYIAPSLIQNVIKLHPAVEDAAVVGVSHKEDFSHTLGLVVLKNNAKNIKQSDIVRFISEKMEEKYHLKGGCKFVNTLPYTFTGKVDRKLILDLINQGKL